MDLNFRNPEPGRPEWWLNRLSKKLDDRNDRIKVYDAYYAGRHPMGFSTPKWKEAFGDSFGQLNDNWCALTVDAVNERMSVTGFRYGDDPASDKKAWKMWQANNLDAMHQMGQLEALVKEESYAIVWPDEDDPKFPVITFEDPSECIVEFKAGSRTKRAAAFKRFVAEDGFVHATLYLSDGLYKFKSERPWDKLKGAGSGFQWQQREEAGEEWPLLNRVGEEIPVVPLMNDPRLLTGGVSELVDVIPLQDAINKTIADMLIASEFVAAPQRYATGFSPPKDEQGNVLPVFEKLLNRLWISSNKDTTFGQFPQADLGPYVKAIEMFVTHFASRTRTPPHYFYLNGQFPSGAANKSAETGLVAKARRKMLVFGEAYEEIIRLGFIVAGEKKRAEERSMETVWADPESRTEGEHIDATVKKRALGVPLQQLWEDAGYSPAQIQRFMQMRKEEMALGLAADPSVADSQQETEIRNGVGTDATAVPTADQVFDTQGVGATT